MTVSWESSILVFIRPRGPFKLPFSMKEFFTGIKAEFTHITWPTAREAFWLSMLVIGIALMVGYYLGLLDATFARILGLLIS